jgi:hypothetical protein
MFRVRQFLEATGEDEEFSLEDTDQLLERECAAVVSIEPESKGDDGKTYAAKNVVKRYMPLE